MLKLKCKAYMNDVCYRTKNKDRPCCAHTFLERMVFLETKNYSPFLK